MTFEKVFLYASSKNNYIFTPAAKENPVITNQSNEHLKHIDITPLKKDTFSWGESIEIIKSLQSEWG